MDILDQAEDLIEVTLSHQIADVRKQVHTLPTTGFCHYCYSPVDKSQHFCDADCRDDYDQRKQAQIRSTGRA